MYALGRTGGRRSINIWPGFVDCLATLLLVVIFVLMVFMIAQYFLSVALSGRDLALQQLREEVSSLADLLSLERADNAELRVNVAQLSAELQTSIEARDALSNRLGDLSEERESLLAQIAGLMSERDDLSSQVTSLDDERAQLAAQLAALAGQTDENKEEAERLAKELADAYTTIDADKEKIEAMVAEIAILQSLRDEVTAKLLAAESRASDQDERLKQMRLSLSKAEEETAARTKLSEEAQRKVDLLNRQIASLRSQLARLNDILDATESQNEEQQVQIADLGRRLNIALASKVQELARYRSEFFGRLREVLGDHPDIRIVGDRFVFQSEVLFETGSAELEEDGRVQLAKLARTLLDISRQIPEEIDWVLRVDGHTDKRPIRTSEFPSNWELSTARAISVVKFLIDQGLPPNRVAATGFGQFQPIDPDDDEVAYRRNRRIELKLTER